MTILSILKNGFDKQVAAQLQQSYLEKGYLFLPGFFDPLLAEDFRSQMNLTDVSHFFKCQYGEDYRALDYNFNKQLLKTYNYLINQKNYVEFLSAVTGNEIGTMQGHFYVSDSSKSRGYPYHCDYADGNRPFFVSINISEKTFDGGVLSMREMDSKKMMFEFQNTNPGGALIVRDGENQEHQVSSVTGDNRRIALISWALKEPKTKRFNMFP